MLVVYVGHNRLEPDLSETPLFAPLLFVSTQLTNRKIRMDEPHHGSKRSRMDEHLFPGSEPETEPVERDMYNMGALEIPFPVARYVEEHAAG